MPSNITKMDGEAGSIRGNRRQKCFWQTKQADSAEGTEQLLSRGNRHDELQ